MQTTFVVWYSIASFQFPEHLCCLYKLPACAKRVFSTHAPFDVWTRCRVWAVASRLHLADSEQAPLSTKHVLNSPSCSVKIPCVMSTIPRINRSSAALSTLSSVINRPMCSYLWGEMQVCWQNRMSMFKIPLLTRKRRTFRERQSNILQAAWNVFQFLSLGLLEWHHWGTLEVNMGKWVGCKWWLLFPRVLRPFLVTQCREENKSSVFPKPHIQPPYTNTRHMLSPSQPHESLYIQIMAPNLPLFAPKIWSITFLF